MTWLAVPSKGKSERDSVLGLHPEAYEKQQAYLDACAARTDPDLLDLSRALIAHMLSCKEELALHTPEQLETVRSRDRSSSLTTRQRSALVFVEQFILDPALITPEMVAELEAEIGTSGVINFASTISAYEASMRLSTLLDLEPAR